MPANDLLHLQRSQSGDERRQLCSRIGAVDGDVGQVQQSNLGLALPTLACGFCQQYPSSLLTFSDIKHEQCTGVRNSICQPAVITVGCACCSINPA